jgi:membrane-associated phospholipid phosphatase
VKLFVERARPEEILGDRVQLSHDRTWAALASYPSGHMVVTGALAAVAARVGPRLRPALVVYVVLTLVGWQIGNFSVGLATSAGLLPRASYGRPAELARAPIAVAREPA